MYFKEEEDCCRLFRDLLKSYADYLEVQHLLVPNGEHKSNILNMIFVGRHSRNIKHIVECINQYSPTTQIWAYHLLQRSYLKDGEISKDFAIDKEILDTLMLYY